MNDIKRKIKTILITLTIFMCFSLSALAAPADKCHNTSGDDAGRWDDEYKPSDRLAWMCEHKVPTYQAKKGRMELENINGFDCLYAFEFARRVESWHRNANPANWFLWNNISCDGGMKIYIK